MLRFTEVQTLAHKLENLCDLLAQRSHAALRGRRRYSVFGARFAYRFGWSRHRRHRGARRRRAVLRNGSIRSWRSTNKRRRSSKAHGEETSFDAETRGSAEGRARRDIEAFEAEVERLLAKKPQGAGVSAPAPPPARTVHRRAWPLEPPGRSGTAAVRPQAGQAGAKVGDQKRTATHQTIRVDIERLDLLLNLVGELVINRTRISDIATTLDRSMKDKTTGNGARRASLRRLPKILADSSALLARTTNEIQESIMKVRMVPIGQVFDRFPRLVRDIAKARGKEVQLKISGAETDLDKTIVDEVGEPLMHLLRNCVDHGLEDPDVREQPRKAARSARSRSTRITKAIKSSSKSPTTAAASICKKCARAASSKG